VCLGKHALCCEEDMDHEPDFYTATFTCEDLWCCCENFSPGRVVCVTHWRELPDVKTLLHPPVDRETLEVLIAQRKDSRNWKVVRSRRGYSADGLPVGAFLCFDEDMVKHAIGDNCISDPVVTNYLDEHPEQLMQKLKQQEAV
jgi:hypothetical protein